MPAGLVGGELRAMGAKQAAVMNRDELLLARRLGDYASRAPVAAMLSALSALIVCVISQQGRYVRTLLSR